MLTKRRKSGFKLADHRIWLKEQLEKNSSCWSAQKKDIG